METNNATPDDLTPNRATIHLILQGKGGVGKSVIASCLSETHAGRSIWRSGRRSQRGRKMNNELAREVFTIVEAKVRSRPSPIGFEMAYQIRVAIDRIRFAIKATEQFTNGHQESKEAGLQLVDALDRLEATDRHFQERFRTGSPSSFQSMSLHSDAPHFSAQKST